MTRSECRLWCAGDAVHLHSDQLDGVLPIVGCVALHDAHIMRNDVLQSSSYPLHHSSFRSLACISCSQWSWSAAASLSQWYIYIYSTSIACMTRSHSMCTTAVPAPTVSIPMCVSSSPYGYRPCCALVDRKMKAASELFVAHCLHPLLAQDHIGANIGNARGIVGGHGGEYGPSRLAVQRVRLVRRPAECASTHVVRVPAVRAARQSSALTYRPPLHSVCTSCIG